MQQKFCGNTMHLQFISQNHVARTFTISLSLEASQTVKQQNLQIIACTFSTFIFVCWYGRLSILRLIFGERSTQFETLVTLVTLHATQSSPLSCYILKVSVKVFPVCNRISCKPIALQDPSLFSLQEITKGTKHTFTEAFVNSNWLMWNDAACVRLRLKVPTA